MRAYVTVIYKTHSQCRALEFVAILTVLLGAPARAGQPRDPLAGHHQVWKRPLPISGEAVVVKSLAPGDRLVVTGTVDTGPHSVVFDARLHTNPGKHFRIRHDHLRFSPRLDLVHGYHRGHRYVFRLPEGSKPQRLEVRFTGLPWRFRVSATHLARVSRSTLSVALWRPGPEPQKSSRGRFALVGIIAVLFGALLAWLLWKSRRSSPSRGTQD
jgi:hypothetical protein